MGKADLSNSPVISIGAVSFNSPYIAPHRPLDSVRSTKVAFSPTGDFVAGPGTSILVPPQLVLQKRSKPISPMFQLQTVRKGTAKWGPFDPATLSQILLGDPDWLSAEDAVCWLLHTGGDALLREFLANRSPKTPLVGLSRPVVFSRQVPVLWSRPRAASSLPISSTRPAMASRPMYKPLVQTFMQEIASTSAPAPLDCSSLFPASPTMELSLKPILKMHQQRTSRRNKRRAGSLWIGKRGKLLASTLATSIATILVISFYPGHRGASTSSAARQQAPSLARDIAASALPAMQAADLAPERKAVAIAKQPPRNLLVPAINGLPVPMYAPSVMRTTTQTAPVVREEIRMPPMLAQAASPVTQTLIATRGIRFHTKRKKISDIAAAAPRKRPEVASLTLPDILKPH